MIGSNASAGHGLGSVPDRGPSRSTRVAATLVAIALLAVGEARPGRAGPPGGPDGARAKAELRSGIALQAAGDLRGALSAYERATVLDPGLAEAHSNLCSVRIARRELETAIEACRRALVLDPSLDPARYNLAQALLGTRRFDEAAKAYEQLVGSRPTDARVSLGLGSAYFGMRAYGDAASAFSRALSLDGTLIEACVNLALTREQLGERRKAAADYRHCATLVRAGPDRDRLEAAARRVEAQAGP